MDMSHVNNELTLNSVHVKANGLEFVVATHGPAHGDEALLPEIMYNFLIYLQVRHWKLRKM